METPKTSYTYELNEAQQARLINLLQTGNYRPAKVDYSLISASGHKFQCTLYEKERKGLRKCLVQGSNAFEFVQFFFEPIVLQVAQIGYEDVLDVETLAVGHDEYAVRRKTDERDWAPHAGSDESGKGDYFGPLVACCVFIDATLREKFRELNVRDCKLMSDGEVLRVGRELRRVLGPQRFALVAIGNTAYNRLYSKLRNLNRLLAWAHATAIEEVLRKQPDCLRVVVDKFTAKKGEEHDEVLRKQTDLVMKRAMRVKGKAIVQTNQLDQHPRAESNPAVAAASIIAREEFLRGIARMACEMGPIPVDKVPLDMIPRGSSAPQVRELAEQMVRAQGPEWLMDHCKVHFITTDKVLAACDLARKDLPCEGWIRSRHFSEGIDDD